MGWPNVDAMLQQISSQQFAEWQAYTKLEPWGEERGDLRAGIVASTIANVNRSTKSTRAFRPQDFMPDFEIDDDEAAAARLLARAKAALGGF